MSQTIGRIVNRQWADSVYPRHSEGAFLTLNDGRILYVYSRFSGSSDDDARCDLVKMVSCDDGETWSKPAVVIDGQKQYGVNNVMSVSLMRMGNGDIGLYYIVKTKAAESRVMLTRSNDEGETFYRHTECTLPDRRGYYVLNNDRVIRLQSGRLMIPLAYHRGGYSSESDKCFMDFRAYCFFLCSDDDGETWHEARDAVYPPFTGSSSGLQEPGLVQLENGVVWSYFRTDQMYHYESFSMDDGEHWTDPQASRFTGPCSPLLIKWVNGSLYAVWNPVPNYNMRAQSTYGGRSPFVIARCENGKWGEPAVLADDPNCNYCYPSIHPTADGNLLVAWLYDGLSTFGCSMVIKKIPASW